MSQTSTTSETEQKEWELPDTVCVRDVETRVFQTIILQSLSKIGGIALIEGNFIDHILGREEAERVRGITVEQNNKKSVLNIKIEVNIQYGLSIPNKTEEIQQKIIADIIAMTGLHVASIHIVFKNIILNEQQQIRKNKKRGEEAGDVELPLLFEEGAVDSEEKNL